MTTAHQGTLARFLRGGGLLLLAALATTSGCGSPVHLTYDFGRAYTATFSAQADLTRPSVANRQYLLYGIEGTKIRLNVQESATEENTGAATVQ
jgi:hypothetical protein